MKFENVTVSFGGFYGSIHSEQVEYYACDICEHRWQDIDYRATNINYCKDWLLKYEEYLEFEQVLKIKFKFKELDSPRYYNFETDKIIADVEIDEETLASLHGIEGFDEYIREWTQSHPGFIPRHSYHDVLADDELTLFFFLEFMGDIVARPDEMDLPHEFEIELLPEGESNDPTE